MIEAIDDKFVKKRKELFGDHKHNLWKCVSPATLNYNDIKDAKDQISKQETLRVLKENGRMAISDGMRFYKKTDENKLSSVRTKKGVYMVPEDVIF